jgi:hypothetical protein
MPTRVTNLELFDRCDRAANEAADKLTMLGDDYREHQQPPTLEAVTRVRNKLREALSAAQELKTRMKQAEQQLRPTKQKT